MSSNKLGKYLAFYRKTLQEDPENIEARLRLAVLFREMGRPSHAIEEYSLAAKLLASQGLPLEAIAACKTILELDPTHRDTQFFLAKLYARVPDATGGMMRVARPVEPLSGPAHVDLRENTSTSAGNQGAKPNVAITLDSPKATRQDLATTIETDYPDAITSPLGGEVADRFAPVDELKGSGFSGDITSVERPSGRRGEEFTALQSFEEQEALRGRAEDDPDDQQGFDLGVFDLESLALEEADTQGLEDRIELWAEGDEPTTMEFPVETGAAPRSRPQPRREFRISALPAIPLFSKLPRQVFLDFLNAMEMGQASAGELLLKPDDPASGLFVIMRGEVRVERELMDGRVIELAQMGEGQVFGEFRLLTGEDGDARVVASTDLEYFRVSDEVVYAIGREHPDMWDVLWGFYYDRMLNHSMAMSVIFGNLNAEERDLVARHFSLAEALVDEVLFENGQKVSHLSLIVSGTVHIQVDQSGRVEVVETLQQGDFLGVTPCAMDTVARATAVAMTDLVLLQMPGRIFRDLLFGLPDVAEGVRRVVRDRNARAGVVDERLPLTKLL